MLKSKYRPRSMKVFTDYQQKYKDKQDRTPATSNPEFDEDNIDVRELEDGPNSEDYEEFAKMTAEE
jgi:hypothetical protein